MEMGQATGSDGGEIQHDLMEMGQATGSGGDGTGRI